PVRSMNRSVIAPLPVQAGCRFARRSRSLAVVEGGHAPAGRQETIFPETRQLRRGCRVPRWRSGAMRGCARGGGGGGGGPGGPGGRRRQGRTRAAPERFFVSVTVQAPDPEQAPVQ